MPTARPCRACLEATLARRLVDRTPFDARLGARGLYVESGVEPTLTLQLFRTYGRGVALDRCLGGAIVEGDDVMPGLYGPHPQRKRGALGELWSGLHDTNWALPPRVFEELGGASRGRGRPARGLTTPRRA